MIDKRTREIAAKMWAAASNLPPEQFFKLSGFTQDAWVAALKVAIAETTSKPKIEGTLSKVCTIGKHGKRVCR